MSVLLIVPPFGPVEIQSLGIHNLEACLRANGTRANIMYLNLYFAGYLGDSYSSFCKMNYFCLGERVFCNSAWGFNPDNTDIFNYKKLFNIENNPIVFFPRDKDITIDQINFASIKANKWLQELEDYLGDLNYKYVGISSSFDQTNASFAIAKKIKKINKNIITFIGGFNCEKDMAKGIESLDPNREFFDYIFSSESEKTIVDFINGCHRDKRIILGEPLLDLDGIPNLDYSFYFRDLKKWLPELLNDNLYIAMETSRGCWWGEKNQCTFCGTSNRVVYREKSTKRVINELESIEKLGYTRIHTADLIMPQKHLKELLPQLNDKKSKLTFYFEEKANLKLDQMELLSKSGVMDIQPGIETLSSSVLKKMNKGGSLAQNIRFLINSNIASLNVFWNIVWGIPGETTEEYKKIVDLLPKILHLTPPVGIFYLTLTRFSPYHNNPEYFNISNIKPLPSYSQVYPKWVDPEKISLIFTGDYNKPLIENTAVINNLLKLLEIWNTKNLSYLTKPKLEILENGNNELILLDTRGIDGNPVSIEIKDLDIKIFLDNKKYTGGELENWCLENHYGILDGELFIPLVIIGREVREKWLME